MKIRHICMLLIAVLVLGGVAGCSGAGSAVSSPAETNNAADAADSSTPEKAGDKAKLVWFTEQMDDIQYDRWMKYVVTPFNEQSADASVEISASADYDQVLRIQLSSGSGPDICNIGGPALTSEYVKGDKLLDITDYVARAGLDKVIFQWALDSCRIDGRLYSLPNSYEALLLFYNVDLFKEHGWSPPTNYQELEALCNEIQAQNLIPISFGTSDFKAINEQFVSVAFSNYAGRDNVKKALNGEIKWTDPIFVEAITLLNDMWQKGWINDKKSHAISSDDGHALFYTQQTAMNMTGTWMLGSFTNQITFDYDAVPFPSLKEGVPPTIPFGAGGVVAVNAATPYPDESFSFIKFLFDNVENQAKAVAEGAQPLPINADESLYPDTMTEINQKVLNTLETTQSNMEQAGHVMWTYWPAETRVYMMDNIENVYLGSLTPEAYLEESQRIFDKEFADGKVIPVV